MDFEDTPEEAAFRAEARAFLDANAERRKPGAVEGYRRGQDAPGAMERAKDFQRRKFAAGFVGIHWPVEWGGRGGTQIQNVIYNQEEAKYDVLSGIFGIGINLAQPSSNRPCGRMRCGASCSPNPAAAPTSLRCARGRRRTATSGW
jgi:alkylation response protein AidB-like acyl-CoA dehydrogenase